MAASWLVLRDSRLVAVREVEVSGASGPQREAIRIALDTAGRNMTTLHLRPEALRAAVAPYAVVRDVVAEPDLPNSLRIRVVQHVAVAAIDTARGVVPVAGDGTVLRGSAAVDVPTVPLRRPAPDDRVTDRRTLQTLELLAVAPRPLRRKVVTAFRGPRGLTVRLAAGPAVHFGSGARVQAKWMALAAVLASPASRGATTIDVRVPEHPAAGGLEQKSLQEEEPSSGA